MVNAEVAVLNEDLDAISINGASISNSFDLSIYIKGDKKATALYSATLVMSHENEAPPVGEDIDVEAASLIVPRSIQAQTPQGRVKPILFTVENLGADPTDVDALVSGEGEGGYVINFSGTVEQLEPGASHTFEWTWTAPDGPAMEVKWTATASAEGDVNPDNNALTAETLVVPFRD